MFYIDYKSRVPLYEQLISSIKEQILKGLLEPETKLPSVRELAASLTINPNTIQKAYSQLEADGYIYSVRGRGNYVATLEKTIIDSQIEDTYLALKVLIQKAKDLGIKDEEFIIKTKELQQEGRKNSD